VQALASSLKRNWRRQNPAGIPVPFERIEREPAFHSADGP
jgi:hypothetical protein